jgi:hypothetical protein
MYSIREFGATGSGQGNEAPAIQSAVDACHEAGGGTVVVPAGNYQCGTIRLRSHVTLHLESGATLWTSPEWGDYETGTFGHGYMLMADDAEHIALTGEGIIRGRGEGPLGRYFGVPSFPDYRVGILLFQRCRHVSIRDLTILYSDAWTVHLKRCENVFIRGLTIYNDVRHINSDGIDPNSCRDVHISDCHIVAGDDCIVLKSTDPYPCENVVVTNCTLETTCAAIKLGTESHGDFRDVHFSNCTIRNTSVGIGFYLKDGATMERVSFSNISIETLPQEEGRHVVYSLFMDIERRNPDSRIGLIRDVVFRDIQIKGGAGALLQGMPESPIENLSLQNVTVRVDESADWSKRIKAIGGRRSTSDERDTLYARKPSYLTFAHIRGLLLQDVRVFIEPSVQARWPRAAVSLHECEQSDPGGL